MSCERGTTYVGLSASLVEPPALQPDLLDQDHLALHGVHRRVGGEEPGADAGAVDHHVRPPHGARQPCRFIRVIVPPRRQHPAGQPVEVDRHLDDRRGERPADVVPVGHVEGLVQVRHGVGPPRLLRSRWRAHHLGALAEHHPAVGCVGRERARTRRTTSATRPAPGRTARRGRGTRARPPPPRSSRAAGRGR